MNCLYFRELRCRFGFTLSDFYLYFISRINPHKVLTSNLNLMLDAFLILKFKRPCLNAHHNNFAGKLGSHSLIFHPSFLKGMYPYYENRFLMYLTQLPSRCISTLLPFSIFIRSFGFALIIWTLPFASLTFKAPPLASNQRTSPSTFLIAIYISLLLSHLIPF